MVMGLENVNELVPELLMAHVVEPKLVPEIPVPEKMVAVSVPEETASNTLMAIFERASELVAVNVCWRLLDEVTSQTAPLLVA
jgi:hypothetical protein